MDSSTNASAVGSSVNSNSDFNMQDSSVPDANVNIGAVDSSAENFSVDSSADILVDGAQVIQQRTQSAPRQIAQTTRQMLRGKSRKATQQIDQARAQRAQNATQTQQASAHATLHPLLRFFAFAGVYAIYFYIAQGVSASLLFPILRHFPPLVWWIKLPLAFCINVSLCLCVVWILIALFSTLDRITPRKLKSC